jgi:murein DD-endopeptidase MepM/ murein hydrolase activator NlpD
MKITKIAAGATAIVLGSVGGVVLQISAANAASATRSQKAAASPTPNVAQLVAPSPSPSPSPSRSCTPSPMELAIAFTSNVRDVTLLNLHLPWGRPGDPEGRMIEDYGAYNGVSIREQLPVHDMTSGTLQELYGHNAIDIVLDSGTPLYAVTPGIAYRITNWTIPGGPQGWAEVVVSDTLRDDSGDPIAFLYGHVREFDAANGQHVDAGELIAKSGGDPDDPGHGFSDMANVHFEVIESAHPLLAHAGTVNPHDFLANLFAYEAGRAACSMASALRAI